MSKKTNEKILGEKKQGKVLVMSLKGILPKSVGRIVNCGQKAWVTEEEAKEFCDKAFGSRPEHSGQGKFNKIPILRAKRVTEQVKA